MLPFIIFLYHRQEDFRVFYNNKDLRIDTTRVNWSQASDHCQQMGYRLVEIEDSDTQSFLHYFLSSVSKLHGNVVMVESSGVLSHCHLLLIRDDNDFTDKMISITNYIVFIIMTIFSDSLVLLSYYWCSLTHLTLDKMAAISQTTFSNVFSWMKIFGFHWFFS